MPPADSKSRPPVVLITNDDGPPSDFSPNVYGFSKLLHDKLGWDVRVVVPDSQKSWVGKAYAKEGIVKAKYFYPTGDEGKEGETTETPRPLKDGESSEWILLSGTPATCTNIGLHKLYPGEIDLVISGPNEGRNTTTAFALSSGTIGGALSAPMSAPMSGSKHFVPSIAVSYAILKRPVSAALTATAHDVAAEICARLWEQWGFEVVGDEKQKTQLYSVNVPLSEEALSKENRKTVWTNIRRNTYGSLFKVADADDEADVEEGKDPIKNPQHREDDASKEEEAKTDTPPGIAPSKSDPNPAKAGGGYKGPLRFKFEPDMDELLNPKKDTLTEGCDSWALLEGLSCVTPLRAEFAGMHTGEAHFEDSDGKRIKPGQMWN